MRSAPPEQLHSRFLLKRRANQREPALAELLEALHDAPVPDAALGRDGNQVALHHGLELFAILLFVIPQVVPRDAHPDRPVVPGNKKADIAEAVVNPGGHVLRQLGLREDMVPVPLVAVPDGLAIREYGLAVVEKSRLLAGQEAEEGARPRRAGLILFRLDVEYRVKKVVQLEQPPGPVPYGFEEPGVPRDVSVVARAAIALRQSCGPEPFADLGGLAGVGLTRMVEEEHHQR